MTPGSITTGLTTLRAVFSLAGWVAYGPTLFQMFARGRAQCVFTLIPAADLVRFTALSVLAQYCVENSDLIEQKPRFCVLFSRPLRRRRGLDVVAVARLPGCGHSSSICSKTAAHRVMVARRGRRP